MSVTTRRTSSRKRERQVHCEDADADAELDDSVSVDSVVATVAKRSLPNGVVWALKKSRATGSRKSHSLTTIAAKLVSLIHAAKARVFDTTKAASTMGYQRRRVYDVLNILEALGIVQYGGSVGMYKWSGAAGRDAFYARVRDACPGTRTTADACRQFVLEEMARRRNSNLHSLTAGVCYLMTHPLTRGLTHRRWIISEFARVTDEAAQCLGMGNASRYKYDVFNILNLVGIISPRIVAGGVRRCDQKFYWTPDGADPVALADDDEEEEIVGSGDEEEEVSDAESQNEDIQEDGADDQPLVAASDDSHVNYADMDCDSPRLPSTAFERTQMSASGDTLGSDSRPPHAVAIVTSPLTVIAAHSTFPVAVSIDLAAWSQFCDLEGMHHHPFCDPDDGGDALFPDLRPFITTTSFAGAVAMAQGSLCVTSK